jgi:hypothetical protein
MRNKLYIVGVNGFAAGLGFVPVEYFLSRKQAQRYITMLWELEDVAGGGRTDYSVETERLYVTAEEAIETLIQAVEEDA